MVSLTKTANYERNNKIKKQKDSLEVTHSGSAIIV
jgi:hypothetical protein